VELTAVRQSATARLTWPSTAYALELLAWDLFLGLSLLFAAPVFRAGKLEGAVRVGFYAAGTLCLVGILGPASGDMRLQFIAVAGYAGVLPAVCLLLALLFRVHGHSQRCILSDTSTIRRMNEADSHENSASTSP
jgi:hypothetical protein